MSKVALMNDPAVADANHILQEATAQPNRRFMTSGIGTSQWFELQSILKL